MAYFQHSIPRTPNIEVEVREELPGYAVIEIGELSLPVMIRDGKIVDCFTTGSFDNGGHIGVTAFADEDLAWVFIENDYQAMHPGDLDTRQ